MPLIGKSQNEVNQETAKSFGASLAELKVVVDLMKTINNADHEDAAAGAERDLRRDRAIAEGFDHRKTIDDKTSPPSMDDCFAFLKVRVEGKIVDATYTAYCASIIRQYFLLRKPVSNKQELAIMHGVMNLHLVNIRPQYDYDLHNIEKYNNCLNFVQNKTIRILNGIYEFPFTRMALGHLNSLRADFTSLLQLLLLTCLLLSTLGITVYIGSCLSGLLFTNPTVTPIMHSVGTTPSVPTSIDTNRNDYPTTTQDYLKTTESSVTWLGNQLSGLISSTSILWTDQKREECTLKLLGWCVRTEESYHESPLSQSWRKLKQTSTGLLDSYMPDMRHLTSSMVATLSHWNERLNLTSILEKEHMTKSLQRFTSWLGNTATTLRETTAASTHTTYVNTYSYVTGFIQNVTTRTKHYTNYLTERYETSALPDMVKATSSTAEGCRAMLTRALATVSSTCISCAQYSAISAIKGMQSLTVTISSYFLQLLSTPQDLETGLGNTIWNVSFYLLKLTLALLSFVALSWYITRTVTQQWHLTLTDYARSMAAHTIDITTVIISAICRTCNMLIGRLIRTARSTGSGPPLIDLE